MKTDESESERGLLGISAAPFLLPALIGISDGKKFKTLTRRLARSLTRRLARSLACQGNPWSVCLLLPKSECDVSSLGCMTPPRATVGRPSRWIAPDVSRIEGRTED